MHYKKISQNIQQIIINNPKTPSTNVAWININNPGKKEIEFLRRKYQFNLNHLHASSAKAMAQRPMVVQEKDYLFMILHFPVFQNNNIIAGEIEFFIGHGFLITLHNNDKILNSFFNICKKDSNSLLSYELESSAILLYEILKNLMVNCYDLLDQNSINIQKIEQIIFSQEQKTAILQILSLKRNIINIRKIMQNHKNVLKKLIGMKSSLVAKTKIKNYYYILIEHSKRIWEILENQKEMIEALHNTNESFLNDRISNIMKTLTIFSVIVFPLNLFAALFGMNVLNGMPFLNTKYGFWIIIATMLVGSFGMLLIFAKKKWL
ncbi:magnesium transporter CorA family protein [Patescibacteria group bacterium]|nr:magnesium transporter CorA family protein [Patescibacteria group bacterium]